MKTCTKCSKTKDESEFYQSKTHRDGLASRCKECDKRKIAEWDKKNPGRKAETAVRWVKNNPERKAELNSRDRKNNPEKIIARKAVYDAVRNGRLTRPEYCSSCFRECKPEGHHPDYSKLLDVKWLCKKCHVGVHSKNMVYC